MMDEVYINQEADPYVLEIDGILDLAGLNLQPASIVINRSATSPTVSSSYSRGTGCHVLTYAGRGVWWMLRQAKPSRALQTFSRMFCTTLWLVARPTLYRSQEHLWQVYWAADV